MTTIHSTRRRVVVTATALFAVMIVGVAFAAWTADGSGTGTATAGDSAALSIAPVSAGTLVPNTSKDVTVRVSNPNEFDVTVLTIDEGDTAVSSSITECDASTVTFKSGGYSYGIGDQVVPTGGTLDITLDDALTMDNGDDDCKGATFTVDLDLTGESYASN